MARRLFPVYNPNSKISRYGNGFLLVWHERHRRAVSLSGCADDYRHVCASCTGAENLTPFESTMDLLSPIAAFSTSAYRSDLSH